VFPSQFVEVIDINRWAGGFLVGLSSTGWPCCLGTCLRQSPGKKLAVGLILSSFWCIRMDGNEKESLLPSPIWLGFYLTFQGAVGCSAYPQIIQIACLYIMTGTPFFFGLVVFKELPCLQESELWFLVISILTG